MSGEALCDDDCDAPCHEVHAVHWKRGHDIGTCTSSAEPHARIADTAEQEEA